MIVTSFKIIQMEYKHPRSSTLQVASQPQEPAAGTKETRMNTIHVIAFCVTTRWSQELTLQATTSQGDYSVLYIAGPRTRTSTNVAQRRLHRCTIIGGGVGRKRSHSCSYSGSDDVVMMELLAGDGNSTGRVGLPGDLGAL